MTLGAKLRLVRSALRSLPYFLNGRIEFDQTRVGDVLEYPDGDRYVVYRETALRTPGTGDGAVLEFRFDVTHEGARRGLRAVLFDPTANLATPFFAGLPGFRRKLWLAGDRPGRFLELYEWATAADADRFVATLEALLEPFEFAGSTAFEVVDAASIDGYVEDRGLEWRDRAP